MRVFNQTKQTTVAESIIEAKSIKDQSIGLLRHKTPTALLIKTRFGIHTFFMRYPIDVIILDSSHHVVAVKEHLKPNSLFLWSPRYKTVIELPSGTIKKTQTKLRDVILVSETHPESLPSRPAGFAAATRAILDKPE